MEQGLYDCIEELNNDFTALNAHKLLLESGLIAKEDKGKIVNFRKKVFLEGNAEEVYSEQERHLIECIDTIIVFDDYIKLISRGVMPCRCICADVSGFGENSLYEAALFIKVITKAILGFTIFVLKTKDGLHIGIRTYEKSNEIGFILSESKDIEFILYGILLVNKYDNFITFYSELCELITPLDSSLLSYEDQIVKNRGIRFNYVEECEELESFIRIPMQYEISRYCNWFDDEETYSFVKKMNEITESLRDITSIKVNTLEMLFEADEQEKIAIQQEKEREMLNMHDNYENMATVLPILSGDPEEIIKMMKMNKGIL